MFVGIVIWKSIGRTGGTTSIFGRGMTTGSCIGCSAVEFTATLTSRPSSWSNTAGAFGPSARFASTPISAHARWKPSVAATNPISSPAAIADRKSCSRRARCAAHYGAERVFLNPDCGFGTFSMRPITTPEIAEAKLATIVQAARSPLRHIQA